METLDLGIPSFTGQTMTLAANILYRRRIAPKNSFLYLYILDSVVLCFVIQKTEKSITFERKELFLTN